MTLTSSSEASLVSLAKSQMAIVESVRLLDRKIYTTKKIITDGTADQHCSLPAEGEAGDDVVVMR